MNRRGIALLIILAVVGAVVVGGGVVADTLVRQNFGIGIFDLFTAVLESGNTFESAESLEDVKSIIGQAAYDDLKAQKDNMTGLMNAASENLAAINSNADVVEVLRLAFGADYKIFMFSYATVGNLTFKVFEWSIGLSNGTVTTFTDGMIFDSYNVKVQVEQSVANDILTGKASTEQLTSWVTEGKLKLNPILEVTRVLNALPKVMEIVQEKMNQ